MPGKKANPVTSPSVARKASEILRDNRFSDKSKSVAGAALSGARGGSKGGSTGGSKGSGKK